MHEKKAAGPGPVLGAAAMWWQQQRLHIFWPQKETLSEKDGKKQRSWTERQRGVQDQPRQRLRLGSCHNYVWLKQTIMCQAEARDQRWKCYHLLIWAWVWIRQQGRRCGICSCRSKVALWHDVETLCWLDGFLKRQNGKKNWLKPQDSEAVFRSSSEQRQQKRQRCTKR